MEKEYFLCYSNSYYCYKFIGPEYNKSHNGLLKNVIQRTVNTLKYEYFMQVINLDNLP